MKKTSLGLSLLALLAPACSSDNTSSAIAIDGLSKAMFDVQCDWAVRCGGLPDTASCATLGSYDALVAAYKAAITAGRIKYSADDAGACIASFKGAACTQGALGGESAACDGTFVGQVADGGACYENDDCKKDSRCIANGASCTAMCCAGTCQAKPAAAAIGASCEGVVTCVAGAHCDVSGNHLMCMADVALGGTCTGGDCAAGLYCDLMPGVMSATCKAPGARGGDCNPGVRGSCASITDWCSSATSKCEARLAVGAACDQTSAAGCPLYAYCKVSGATGTCTVRPTTGEMCDRNAGLSCMGALECTNGACVLPADDTPACP